MRQYLANKYRCLSSVTGPLSLPALTRHLWNSANCSGLKDIRIHYSEPYNDCLKVEYNMEIQSCFVQQYRIFKIFTLLHEPYVKVQKFKMAVCKMVDNVQGA